MSTYGKYVICEWDPPSGGSAFFKPRYRLEILKKDHTGTPQRAIGAVPVVIHSYDDDDPKPGIKTCSLEMNLINEGSLPLKTFYSTNDDEFLVRLYWLEVGLLIHTTDRLLFEGFLVQDDCSELMVDYNHVIKLTASDNLKLLKDIAFNEAPAIYDPLFSSVENYEITYSPTADLLVSLAFGDSLIVGDKLSIDGGPLYTIKELVRGGNVWNVMLVEQPTQVPQTTGTILIYRATVLDKMTLLQVLRKCFSATDLELETDIYCNLLEINHLDTNSFLAQTLIDPQTFLKNATDYYDCFTILERELKRFHLTLFQAEGRWNIVRWDELRYYANNIPGFRFDKDFNLLQAVTMQDAVTAGIGEDTIAEFGLTNEIFRPFKYVKETFNYKQPPQLLRNYDFQQVGALLRSYTTGSGVDLKRIKEYEMKWWEKGFTWTSGGNGLLVSSAERFIRVVSDSLDNEIQRFGVIKGNTVVDDPSAAASYKIEVNAGDTIKYSFSYRTSNSQPGNVNNIFDINLVTALPLTPKAANNRYLGNDGTWKATRNFTFNVGSGDNTNEWHNVEVTSDRIPFDGLLYIKLAQASFSSQETHYRDLRLEYIATINESTKVIGHTHKSEQATKTKQKEDEEIYMDSSPRNSIMGTLFLNATTGILQKRAETWLRGHMVTVGGLPMERLKLGKITTFEQLFWRQTARTILKGRFYGLLRNNKHRVISMLTVMRYNYFAGLNFVIGDLEIDYGNDNATCTLHEMYADGETDAGLVSIYEHKYLYDVK